MPTIHERAHQAPGDRGYLIDRLTQQWVRATGRRVDLTEHLWLDGPTGDPRLIGDHWVTREAARLGGQRIPRGDGAGLLASMQALAGDGFDPGRLRPEIVDFYEHTADWRLELWSQWSAAAWPFGWALSLLFARRLQQLTLPLRPLDVSRGIDSQVVCVADDSGAVLGAAWLRTLRRTGKTIYSGWYGAAALPGRDQPSVRVVFPLPNGSVTVLLRPEPTGDGNLRLVSPLGRFGDDGAYLVVRDHTTTAAWVRRAPLAERFDVYLDPEGVLRCDHDVRLWRIPVIQLHYRLDRRTPDRTRSRLSFGGKGGQA